MSHVGAPIAYSHGLLDTTRRRRRALLRRYPVLWMKPLHVHAGQPKKTRGSHVHQRPVDAELSLSSVGWLRPRRAVGSLLDAKAISKDVVTRWRGHQWRHEGIRLRPRSLENHDIREGASLVVLRFFYRRPRAQKLERLRIYEDPALPPLNFAPKKLHLPRAEIDEPQGGNMLKDNFTITRRIKSKNERKNLTSSCKGCQGRPPRMILYYLHLMQHTSNVR